MDEMLDTDDLRAAIAANLTRLRKTSGLSQTEIAKKAGISRIYLSRLENGHDTPRADVLYSLADVFAVDADDLRKVADKILVKSP
jgi:transcriptional regulator with XRE-family HTH domain